MKWLCLTGRKGGGEDEVVVFNGEERGGGYKLSPKFPIRPVNSLIKSKTFSELRKEKLMASQSHDNYSCSLFI